jgi:4-methyl-5(b-hydroxyethyl)-thiazole monophosphate biosynthesis
MAHVVVVLAQGFEEMEAVAPIDLCRRAGLTVTVAGLTREVISKRGLKVTCDVVLPSTVLSSSVNEGSLFDWDALVLPGGLPGANNLAASPAVQAMVDVGLSSRLVAAICAAPSTVLGPTGRLRGRRWTGFPGTDNEAFGGTYLEDCVVVDGRLITSRAVATAPEFALTLIGLLCGQSVADRVARETLFMTP